MQIGNLGCNTVSFYIVLNITRVMYDNLKRAQELCVDIFLYIYIK